MNWKLITAQLLLASFACFAQAPAGFNYQGVARDGAGVPVASKTIKVKLSVLDGSVTGTVLFAETQSPLTSSSGLFSVIVGNGTAVTGTFAGINWASASSKFLKTEIDLNGGNSFTTVATTQMMSVPYALYAQTSGTASVNTVSNSDLALLYDNLYVSNNSQTGINGQYSGFLELKASWKDQVINSSFRLFLDGVLDSYQSGMSIITTSTGRKTGIGFGSTGASFNTAELVAYFQTETGQAYKKTITLTKPSIAVYADGDGDGYGVDNSLFYTSNLTNLTLNQSSPGVTFVTQGGDCYDNNAAGTNIFNYEPWIAENQAYGISLQQTLLPSQINPGATELANGIDDNCNGQIDEGFTTKTWYADKDKDGYGAGPAIVTAFPLNTLNGLPSDKSQFNYYLNSTDCDDNSATVHPGATEVLNMTDDNCDGTVDNIVMKPVGASCVSANECTSGICNGNTCVSATSVPCTTNANCPSGTTCGPNGFCQ